MFCHKITFYYVRKAHSLMFLGLSLTDTHSLHTPAGINNGSVREEN